MNINDLIYASGFLDGEGTFMVVGPSARKSSVVVKMMNSYRPVVEWFHKTFGGTFKSQGRMNVKPIYAWYLSGENAVEFMQMIEPFLKEKQAQVKLILEFRGMGLFSHWNQITPEILEKRQTIITQLKELRNAHY